MVKLLALLSLFSCCFPEGAPPMPEQPPGRSVAILGDSISLYYPALLEAQLGPDYIVDNYAVGGTQSPTILGYWRNEVRGKPYDAVVIMAGVNDLVGFRDTESTHEALSALYSEPQVDGLDVFVLTILPIPDQDPPRVVTNERIPALNAWIVEQPGIIVIDTWAAFGGDTPNLTLYQHDLLHPDEDGQALIANLVAEQLQ